MTLPRKIEKAPRFNMAKRIRSPSHCKWVREHACCVPGCQKEDMHAAHVRTGTLGGTGLKPGDDWVISLCSRHHSEQHMLGEPAFERFYGIDMKALAREFAAKSKKLKSNRP